MALTQQPGGSGNAPGHLGDSPEAGGPDVLRQGVAPRCTPMTPRGSRDQPATSGPAMYVAYQSASGVSVAGRFSGGAGA